MHFTFNTNHMPYFDRNIPCEISYTSFGPEILRFSRGTTDLINMETRINLLLIG